jgi:vacuolar protein sorting-associated protein 53
MIDDSVLDSEDFDPIEFINRKFPTESSLDELDTFTLGISSQMSALDEELSKAVQSQIASGEQASKEIIDAQKSIEELFHKISDIKAKASQSERMVQEICADIKKLDYAKTHLQSSITALKRLQMLTTAISQLTALIGDPSSYRDIANLLDATTQIMKYFSHYGSIPLIASTKLQLEELQVNLKKNVSRTFRELGQLVEEGVVEDYSDNQKSSHASLSDSCMIVDALGYTFRYVTALFLRRLAHHISVDKNC